MAHEESEVLPLLPDVGFYYHYKHDPYGAVNNYAYYVFNVGYHTEDDCRPVDQYSVDYLPLYEEAYVYRLGKGRLSDSRPLSLFMSMVEKGGILIPRFAFITDPDIIDVLMSEGGKLYPHRKF